MKNLRNRIAGTAAVLALTAGAGLAAAAPAQAATTNYKYWWMGLNRCAMVKVVDYNWFEETVLGYRDSSTIVGYVNMNWCRAGI